MYYNTNNLQGEELKKERKKNESQKEVILSYFQSYSGPFTPRQVDHLLKLSGRHWELTSIRRAMCDLTAAGSLMKTDVKINGPKGVEYLWCINNNERMAA